MKPTQEQVIAWAEEAGVGKAFVCAKPDECPDDDGCCHQNKQDGYWVRDDKFLAALTIAYEAGRKDENEATDAAYKERNQLVALLSTCFQSGRAKTSIEGWDEAWHGCVYINFPWGQASWHYHDSDAWMFEHLPPYNGQWDGHTTEQKDAAIAAAIRARREQ